MAINRFQLVTRHNPVLKALAPESPLSVGNGEFAFTVDITGLQTFPETYEGIGKMPLCTLAQWGWHSYPLPVDEHGSGKTKLEMQLWDVYGRKVGYPTSSKGQEEIFHWLRQNPHKMHLGRIGLRIIMSDGRRMGINDIKDVNQVLNLWTGVITSKFTVEGIPVTVETCCHPTRDILGISVESTLIQKGRLSIEIVFPYGSHEKTAADWSSPEKHRTEITARKGSSTTLLRRLDEDIYFVNIDCGTGGTLKFEKVHVLMLEPVRDNGRMEFTASFSSYCPREDNLPFSSVLDASTSWWKSFWNNGGAVELAESSDARALELERRIVLSQYLTAINCAGSLPPQETGLTCNSWFGKFHLEMHYWHAAHFPLWGRTELLERSLWWYKSILDRARQIAREQGYRGARWPKMSGPKGTNDPSTIAPLLIWQQPHPIVFAELCYRSNPSKEILELYGDIVFESAEFMASYVEYDAESDRFVLGPPLATAQESLCSNGAMRELINPAFELEYWRYGLSTAQAWRERMGLKRDEQWDRILEKLSPLPVANGLYIAAENRPDTFEKYCHDHPTMLAAYGILPGKNIDKKIMMNTLYKVMNDWEFDKKSWGWDFPMVAATAARLGRPDLAINALFAEVPSNTYLKNGHNANTKRPDLPLYLPGNGALLLTVAMMAAGWDGCPDVKAPGFPQDGSWKVEYEGLRKMI